MKTKHSLIVTVTFSVLCLLLSSCNENGASTYAPSNVAGKTMTIHGTGVGTIHIAFTSNSSARITRNDGESKSFSSISYRKTNPNAATVRINGIFIDFGSSSATEDENLSLIFTSSSQGIVNGTYNRRWNDGRTTNGSIENETFTIF